MINHHKKSVVGIVKWPEGIQLILVLLAIVLLSSCGREQDAAASNPLPDAVQACEILSKAEVEALLGGPVDAPRKTFRENKATNHWMSMCNYDSLARQISLGITIKPHGNAGDGRQALADHEAEMKAALGQDYRLETVSGLGDAAGWDASSKQLTIFEGPYLVIANVVSPKLSSSDALSLCQQFCQKFLDKLPAR